MQKVSHARIKPFELDVSDLLSAQAELVRDWLKTRSSTPHPWNEIFSRLGKLEYMTDTATTADN
ncbi:MAG: hypothetical protein AAF950_14690 [Pseudomonadota bacterium]